MTSHSITFYYIYIHSIPLYIYIPFHSIPLDSITYSPSYSLHCIHSIIFISLSIFIPLYLFHYIYSIIFIPLYFIPFHSISFCFIPFHSISFHSISFHSIPLPYITLHCNTLHHITLHKTILHYITYGKHYIYIHMVPIDAHKKHVDRTCLFLFMDRRIDKHSNSERGARTKSAS